MALLIAERLIAQLAPACERIEVAGSIRRERDEVHDIELVAVPRVEVEVDLFGDSTARRSLLDPALVGLGRFDKNGERYKQIYLPDGIYHDLFLVLPPAQWGVILTIRTGPADFSHWLVTPKRQGGAMPAHLRVHDGALWQGNEIVPTPEEKDFFAALGLPYVEPRERRARWNHVPEEARQ
jgi:DNA polymerase/3'-5' exonuclease PolX